jgi:GWxTD domain-containing protein
MTLAAVFTLLALAGFSLSWNSLPAQTGETGSAQVSVILSPADLLAVSSDSGSVTSYEITATIDGDDFTRRSSSVVNGTFPIVEVLSYTSLAAGGHTVSVVLTDLESGAVNRREEEILIDSSSVSFWSSSGVRTLPSGPMRSSGSVSLNWSVYPPVDLEISTAAYAILDSRTEVVREGWLAGEVRDEGVVTFSADVSLSSIPRGRYRITVAALQGDEVVASSSSSLEILDAWDVWGDDPDETVTLIRPIATSNEIREIERAGGLGDRNSVMADFWSRRDPNPGTRENEFLEEYLVRLDRISGDFGTTGVRGINTDRGVVFAKMGEPDIIEDFPFEIDNYPCITWEYFTPSLSVAFVDRNGYGFYEIVEGWETVNRAFNAREEWSR